MTSWSGMAGGVAQLLLTLDQSYEALRFATENGKSRATHTRPSCIGSMLVAQVFRKRLS